LLLSGNAGDFFRRADCKRGSNPYTQYVITLHAVQPEGANLKKRELWLFPQRSRLVMRISTRAFLRSTLPLFLAAGVFAPNVSAGIVFSNFDGTVLGKNGAANFPGNVQLNDTLSTNSYFEYSTPKSSSGGVYQFAGTSNLAFALIVNTPVTVGSYTGSTWGDSYATGGNYTITMTWAPTTKITTMTINVATGGGSAQKKTTAASATLVFTSSNYATTLTAGEALPTQANLGLFQTNVGSFTWDPGTYGIGGSAQLIGQSVPEPSSLVLAVGAIGTCAAGFLISRRKAAEARHRG
jgi:hypothetical protein